MQSKVEKEADRSSQIAEKERQLADIQLTRVRAQMSEALEPMNTNMWSTYWIWLNLMEELNLTMYGCSAPFENALTLSSHIKVPMRMQMFNNSQRHLEPYSMYDAAALAELDAEPSKRDRFVEVHADCLVPLYLEFDAIYSRTRHL
jgi:hypothetical protein